MDPSNMSQDERSLTILQCGDVHRPNEHSEVPKSKKREGSCYGDRGEPLISMGDVSDSLKRESSTSVMSQLLYKPPKTTGPGTSQSVDNKGNCQPDAGSKSHRISQLEETVNRLKNALVSLEEENLLLNKKVKGSSMAEETINHGSPDFKPRTPSERSCMEQMSSTEHIPHESPKKEAHFQNTEVWNESVDCSSPSIIIKIKSPSEKFSTDHTLKERPKQEMHSLSAEIRQEARKMDDLFNEDVPHEELPCETLHHKNGFCRPVEEKQDVQKKLKRVEEYCKECTRELGRVLRKYEEARAQNKALEKRCKQLTCENQQLTESLDRQKREAGRAEGTQNKLEAGGGTKALLDQAQEHCASLGLEKEELEGKVAVLSNEVAHLKEELEANRLEAQKAWDQATLLDMESKAMAARMAEEASCLQDKLRESEEKSEQCEGELRKLREEHAVLESCVCTVQKERDILQLEVRKLHQEYIELSGNISLQLRAKNSSGNAASLVSHDTPSFLTRQDKVIDGEKIDQIRRRLEEEEMLRAQKYKNIIDQSV